MARFGSEAELATFLGKLDEEYAKYAAALWQTGIRTSWQLLNASKHILLSAGLPELHVDDIKASAGDAAMGPGGLDYETLHRKLSLVRSYVDPKVLNQMIRFFAPQIPLADQQLLSQLYDTAKASPLTSTRASLRVNEGLVFNGAFAGGTPSRAVLLIAFENGMKPVMCKFTVDPQDVVHEAEVLEHLWLKPALTGVVGPVKLVKVNPPRKAWGQVAPPNGGALQVKHCLQMPVYPATLQHMPIPMAESVVLFYGRQLKSTLQIVHSKNYGHNDVKAANVFISSRGDCILGDFGSAMLLGRHTREHTPTHWPAEFENTSLSLHETSVAVDFFQLTVTLLERTGCYILTGNPTPAKCRESLSRLQNPELSSFVSELLQPQA